MGQHYDLIFQGQAQASGSPWHIYAKDGHPHHAANAFLDYLWANASANTVSSYGYDLVGWLGFLQERGRPWDAPRQEDVAAFVSHLRMADTRDPDRVARHNFDHSPRTINRYVAAIARFYEYCIGRGLCPLQGNPMPETPKRAREVARPNRHRPPGRLRIHGPALEFRQAVPDWQPESISDASMEQIRGVLRTDRDRAMIEALATTGARARELLSMRLGDMNPGDLAIRVRRTKGGEQSPWLTTSPDFFTHLTRYLMPGGERARAVAVLAEAGGETHDFLWINLHTTRRGQIGAPLTYGGLRALMERVNAQLGTDFRLHQFRHRCAQVLLDSEALALDEVQVHLGHVRVETTQVYAKRSRTRVHAKVAEFYARRSAPESAAPETEPVTPSVTEKDRRAYRQLTETVLQAKRLKPSDQAEE